MEHLAPVVASLTLAKANLQEELEVINQMLQLAKEAETSSPTPTPARPLVNDKRRAVAGDKAAQKREEESRWKNGASPKSSGGKKKKDHPVQEKIVTDLLARAQEHRKAGKSFTPTIPGSFTAQELADEAGYSIDTVRRAFKELEKRGSISARKMSWKDLGKTSPAGPTNVLVATTLE